MLIPIVLGLGLVAGAVNGLLVAYVRLPAIIATLGAYLFYHGLGVQILDPRRDGARVGSSGSTAATARCRAWPSCSS